jgi:acetyl-CoA carboxylase biotin carboxyl carrier protein
MTVKEIEALIDFINKSGLGEVNVETEEIKLSIKRHSDSLQKNSLASMPAMHTSSSSEVPILASLQPALQPHLVASEPTETANYITIKSPMIGTFYRAVSPEAAPFVEEGQVISEHQTVCIIEAMKLFNEIEAEVAGKIVKILVEDASPVEYDQPLFLVKPEH